MSQMEQTKNVLQEPAERGETSLRPADRDLSDEDVREVELAAARFASANLKIALEKSMDAGVTLSIWLLASLLTLNSGALAALAASDSLRFASDALGWFLAGAVIAICTGAAGLFLYQWLIPGPIGEALMKWELVPPGHVTLEEALEATEPVQSRAWKIQGLSIVLGLASLVCFVVGCLSIDLNVKSNQSPSPSPSSRSSSSVPSTPPTVDRLSGPDRLVPAEID